MFLWVAAFIMQLPSRSYAALPLPGGAGRGSSILTLPDAIALARLQSIEAQVALDELRSAYWAYRSYRAEMLPEVSLSASLPTFNKSYSAYQLSDGTYDYVRSNNVGLNGRISITQNIWPTGGTLSLSTSLDYLKDGGGRHQFMSVPVALTLNQPIFGTNYLRWNRRIEPLRYRTAKAEFLSATEDVARSAIRHYFNWLLANENVEIYRQNLSNARRLYEVAKAKREMGQISENDVLQLRLNMLQAESALTEGISTMRSQDFALKNFLDLPEEDSLRLEVPDSVADIIMNYQDVLDKAQQNNAFAQRMALYQLESDYSVALAKGNLRQINLYASVGLTGTSHELGDAYNHTGDNQVVQVGVSVPLLDWGKRRGRVKVAESNRKVTESRLREQRSEFRQNIFILTEQFNNQLRQLHIAEEADRIAQRRYHTNVETFLIGKISTLDLNDAQSAKDQARIKHISELYSYWSYYYQLRSLTLWDFEKNIDINADFEKLIRYEQK